MKKDFAELFERTPDRVENGDYYYRVPWMEEEQKRYGTWTHSAEDIAYWEQYSRQHFMSNWKKRTFDGEFSEAEDYTWLKNVKGKGRNPELFRIFSHIAASGTPIVDIASSEDMGMIPYILKLNPNVPCLVTDIDSCAMQRLRARISENLPEYDISIASFDNLDMPFSDDSVPYITGFGSITSCFMNKNWVQEEETDPNIRTFEDFMDAVERKAISEVYRVLKPSGLFVIADGCDLEWDYDLQEVNAFFENHDLLYGLYSRDMVLEKIEHIEIRKNSSAPWNEKLLSAGFEVVFANRTCEKLSPSIVAACLSVTGDPVEIAEPHRDEDIIRIYAPCYTYVLRKPETGL